MLENSTNDPPARRGAAERERIERLAWLLDDSIPLPVVDYRIGVDPIIGLVPGIGDALGAVLSGYIVFEGGRLGASRAVLLRMVLNAAIGAVVGMIPLFGTVFDAFWKANERNVRLLKRHLDAPGRTARRSRWALWGALAALLVIIAAAVGLGVLAIGALL